jgi:hypothetical protein
MWSWIGSAVEVGHTLSRKLAEVVHEAERLGEEALDGVMRIWDQLDDLPFIPAVFKIPPITRQLYAHGAFMGAAPALLADERWRRILAFLMPDVYTDVTEAMADEDPATLIPMFENNPVMAAFGIWRSVQARAGVGARLGEGWDLELLGMEWDLFIDGDLAETYMEAAADEQPAIFQEIFDSAVIAHAAALDTLQENLGFCQHVDVRKTRKSRLGGVGIRAWLDLFARALQLAQADDPAPLLLEMAAAERILEGEACVLSTFAQPMSPREAVSVYRAVTGRPYFSVVLDMKSLRNTPKLFATLIRSLNTHGIYVAAACSFHLEEIEGLSSVKQLIDEVECPGPREVLFFHFAGDLQRACDAGEVPAGVSVLFNGASLLSVDDWFSSAPTYGVKEAVISDLERYRQRHRIEIGLYVQEGDCDSVAAAMLGDIVVRHEKTFALGFAWGGLSGEVAVETGGEPRMGHGSQILLSLIGTSQEWSLPGEE